jgi:pheromone shutdown protein TraB
MTGQGMKLDPETSEALKSSDTSGIAASVEALKTKKAAEAMTAALRQFNPKLAKALIDDRDEVTIH